MCCSYGSYGAFVNHKSYGCSNIERCCNFIWLRLFDPFCITFETHPNGTRHNKIKHNFANNVYRPFDIAIRLDDFRLANLCLLSFRLWLSVYLSVCLSLIMSDVSKTSNKASQLHRHINIDSRVWRQRYPKSIEQNVIQSLECEFLCLFFVSGALWAT